MKKVVCVLAVLAMVFGIIAVSSADTVNLYLDTCPNASGSPDWPSFRDAAYANIAAGTFINQEHSTNPTYVGSLNYEATDAIVYSFGDLGKRLHTFYFIPNETTTSLAGRFQISVQYQYDGIWYNAYDPDEWVTPTSWVDTAGGVMGSMGMAYWGAYGYTSETPEALAALALDIQDVNNYAGDMRFLANLDGTVFELDAHHNAAVPLPGTLLLLGSGLTGLVLWRRRQAGAKS